MRKKNQAAKISALNNAPLPEKIEILKLKSDLHELDVDWDIAKYLIEIKNKQKVSSFRAVARLLNVSPNSINQMRYGKMLPSEETILKMAHLAGRDEIAAILDLRLLKSAGETREIYLRLKKGLMEKLKGVLTVLIIVFTCLNSHPSFAAVAGEQNTTKVPEIYIITQKRLRKYLEKLGNLLRSVVDFFSYSVAASVWR